MDFSRSLSISILPERIAIWRLPPEEAVPARPPEAGFWSVSATEEEISVVSPEEHVQSGRTVDRGWLCLKVQGPLEFDQMGILASLADPLSRAGIPIFVISTYETDYLLVKEENLGKTVTVLESAGHRFMD